MASSNSILESTTAFAGLHHSIGELTLRESRYQTMICLAFAPDLRNSLDAHCSSSLGTSLPAIGCVSHTKDGQRLLGLQYDQIWYIEESTDERDLFTCLGTSDGLYLTDIGDGWATLILEGGSVISVLERLCPLDLDSRCFPVDTVSRTVMEHVATVMVRTGDSSFEIMIPRSLAGSFLHAVESVAGHIHGESQH